jgi:gluconate 5-dehydrogenase
VVIYPNNWIPTASLEEMEKTFYDVLIVGSGAGGGASLYRLCEMWKNHTDKKIGILEKGNLLFHSNALNIPTMNITRMREQLFYDNSTPVGHFLPDFPGARLVYALGGRTLFWNAWSPRPPQFELLKWPMNQAELNAYYSLAEKVLHVTSSYANGSVLQSIMMNRLYENNIINSMDSPVSIDMSATHLGEIHSNAWFSTINFLALAMNDKPYDLGLNAFVSKLFVEQGKISGVEVIDTDKNTHIIHAKNIILSAGALETPRLLLNSGIQGPAIGHYLTDHLTIFDLGKINRRQFGKDPGVISILIYETAEQPYQIQLLGPDQYYAYQQFEEKILPEEISITLATFGKTESLYENRVYIDSSRKDQYGIPEIQVDFSYSNKDRFVASQMVDGILKTSSAINIDLLTTQPNLSSPGSDLHESCTCRMGIDPETSVVNSNGQIHEVPGLYVADNSTLPTLAAANPTLTTVALSIRLADHIVIKSYSN